VLQPYPCSLPPFIRPLTLIALALPAAGVEIRIQHSAIKRILTDQVFTDEGRRYVRASRSEKCDYAYLENPEIGAAGNQLRIRARFTGRTAAGLFGRCIGIGDSFTAVIYATPYYAAGMLRLRDVRVDSEDRDGFYIRRVRATLEQSLPQQFSYPLQEHARKILEEERPNAHYQQQLVRFGVTSIRVTAEGVILTLDFVLTVK